MWLLGDAQVSTLETRVRFERAITFDPTVDVVILVVDVESLLGEAQVFSLETSVPVRKAITYDPTVRSLPNS
jgi:hypothetical protein